MEKPNLKKITSLTTVTIKEITKKYNFKIISYCIYSKTGDYFFKNAFLVNKKDKKVQLLMQTEVKLYDYDDIFWEVFDMKENSARKDSLRAIGAFAAPAVIIDQKTYIIQELSDIEQICEEAIREFTNNINSFKESIKDVYGNFDSFALKQKGIFREELIKILAYIHLEDYQSAKNLAEYELSQGRGGGFRNKGVDINDFVVRFCRKKIEEINKDKTLIQ